MRESKIQECLESIRKAIVDSPLGEMPGLVVSHNAHTQVSFLDAKGRRKSYVLTDGYGKKGESK